jgi:two-component system, NtrC family, response regulator HydG
MPRRRVLVVDDNLEMASTIADYLRSQGFEVETVSGGAEGLARFASAPADAVLTDLRMQDVDGMDVLEGIRRIDPDAPVVIMTAFGAIDTAVEAIRRGAYHYVTKPFKMDVVRVMLERACSERSLRSENDRLRRAVEDRFSFASLVGRSPEMQELYTLIERVAAVPLPALILGETGTGKELVARAIHAHGPRAKAAFVAVNCAALPEALLESELFGHARGAFTGATQPRRGLFVEADGGTLLLDEIGDMPLALQAKLLRVLESGEIRPVGSDTVRHCDVRLLAATHRVLEDLVREGKFREDLYYRLRVLSLRLTPLRERREDIPLLLEHFLTIARRGAPTALVAGFTPEAVALLGEHSWPGNVRELEHLVQSLVVTGSEAKVGADSIRTFLRAVSADHPLDRARKGLWSLRELEQEYINWVVEHTRGNKTRASEILGIDPSTIYRRELRGRS